MERVAVIGGGPAGIAVTRYLISEGFDPVVFERGSRLGGQWTGEAGSSGVWPTLHTNTSRTMTAFSDLPLRSDAVFPGNQEVQAYLEEYAERFGVTGRVRLDRPVRRLARSSGGWSLTFDDGAEEFPRVVVATGRFHAPHVPHVDGLDSFSGSEGVVSTYDYKDPERYRGRRVLVAGCAVSALEIAADLAALGAARVAVTQRRQRYVLAKYAAGVPSDHRLFTRYLAHADATLPRDEVGRLLKEIVLAAGGSPEQYGAPAPADDLFAAGVTLNQQYLPLVGEGRITVHPWMRSVEGTRITFTDGTVEEFDAIVLGTGFDLSIPFLDDHIRAVLDLDDQHADLDRWTFHPDLPGLAFLGLWDQSGPYLVPIELQARWVAYSWSGRVPAPTFAEMRASVDAYRARRGQSQKTRMNLVAGVFARAAGVEPDPDAFPELRRGLWFGPLAPSQYRLVGPDALPDAAERFAADLATFGAITDPTLTGSEVEHLARLASADDGVG